MDIIEITRELGRAIQQDECYSRYLLAKDANDKDEELQNLIGEFNLKRIAINSENSKADKDQARLEHLNEELTQVYERIMANPHMQEYNAAKVALDSRLQRVNTIIMMCANGADPDTADASACSGSCDGCSSCS